jgi:CheY-like chemotaxis protein
LNMNIVNKDIIDITMPVMDGLAATREIRKHERELGLQPATIIALTGASSLNARERAIGSGVDEFFTKPVPLSVVKSLVDEWKQQSFEDHEQRLHVHRESATVFDTL